MQIRKILISLAVTLLMVSVTSAASIEKAEMLSQHGLPQQAKSELIDILFSKSDDAEKAKSYYLLGSIAFDENRISVALDSWRQLVQKYPNSTQAKTVKDRISELAEIVGESTKESVQNAIASSYLRHGDFWSRGKDENFNIDSSWIQNVEAANKWYDKVISEYPNTVASSVAYQNKMRTILGWETPGKYGSKYGLKDPEGVGDYLPQLLETFAAFEKEFPTASTIQSFRYQIAQVYWRKKDWKMTREWLNLILKDTKDRDSFYKDLAERRLLKVEY